MRRRERILISNYSFASKVTGNFRKPRALWVTTLTYRAHVWLTPSFWYRVRTWYTHTFDVYVPKSLLSQASCRSKCGNSVRGRFPTIFAHTINLFVFRGTLNTHRPSSLSRSRALDAALALAPRHDAPALFTRPHWLAFPMLVYTSISGIHWLYTRFG